MHRYIALLFLAIVSLSACSLANRNTPESAWGIIITFGHSEQSAAPQIWPHADGVTAYWIGADETGVHHDAVQIVDGTPSKTTVLPLPPVHPYNQMMLPAARGRAHILWLDADTSRRENRLFSGILRADTQPERGPVLNSNMRTARYTALPNRDGSVTIIWSGGAIAEPSLYLQGIDPMGRPQLPRTELINNADWPTIARTNDGVVYLAWQQVSSGATFIAELVGEQLENIQQVPPLPNRQRGDRITDFRLALDHTHRYLFWNITHADNQSETWMATSALNAQRWQRPVRVGIRELLGIPFETGFNSGMTNVATTGDRWASHAMPLSGQFETLPVAAKFDEATLGVMYFRRGSVQGFQAIVNDSPLLSSPSFAVDRDRHLYLAWSSPTLDGTANLNVTMTRRLS
ncbi:MAG: hypothetical protein D6737_01325 [Chloroflexi bacterium]|nr:MAG: hypothetical protein CUN54_07095 [Phototrophicales bacterium]RMF82584.1 MAG: hypothetical protein D6737_01325 [Chloroflexota bacterium]